MGGAGLPGMMPGGPVPGAAPGMPPGMPGQMPGQTPIQNAGEDVITKLLQMASSNPQMLMGLSLAGAAREVSQLSGLSRRRQGGGAGGRGTSPAMPPAAALLSGNAGDIDRMMAIQQMLAGAGGGQPMGAPPQGPAQSPLLAALAQGGAGLV